MSVFIFIPSGKINSIFRHLYSPGFYLPWGPEEEVVISFISIKVCLLQYLQVEIKSVIFLLVCLFGFLFDCLFCFVIYRSLCTVHLCTELICNYTIWILLISPVLHFLQHPECWIDCILKTFLLVFSWRQTRQKEAENYFSFYRSIFLFLTTTAIIDVVSHELSQVVFPVL